MLKRAKTAEAAEIAEAGRNPKDFAQFGLGNVLRTVSEKLKHLGGVVRKSKHEFEPKVVG